MVPHLIQVVKVSMQNSSQGSLRSLERAPRDECRLLVLGPGASEGRGFLRLGEKGGGFLPPQLSNHIEGVVPSFA